MHTLFNQLPEITVDRFLREYWQRQPLLIPRAFPEFQSPIDANELAGVAMESDVESRIVLTDGWQLRHGPFAEKDFANLPDSPWTLLVQGLDQLIPEVAELLEHFRFLPTWRLDDIMASFATDGGGVGPHFDQYDVFLLQAQGQRRWRLGEVCDASASLLENTELAILKKFQCRQEYVLNPGDILYLPPGVAHWGTALGECMTFSIGFRAPNTDEIIAGYCDFILGQALPSPRFQDQELSSESDPYLIDDKVLQRVRAMLLTGLDKPELLATWFGQMMTNPRYDIQTEPLDNVKQRSGDQFKRSPDSRLAYYPQNDMAFLFANGQHWQVSLSFAQDICVWQTGTMQELKNLSESQEDRLVLQSLIDLGIIVLCQEL